MGAPNGKLPAGVKVQFAANKYYLGKEFVTTRVTAEDYPAEGDFKLKVGSDGINGHAQLPEALNFIIEIPTIGKFKGTTSVRLAWMTKQFLDTPPFNILVAGMMGGGKTSLINGFANLFGVNDELQTFHMAYSSQNHVTRSYNCTPFSHYIDENSGMGQFIN